MKSIVGVGRSCDKDAKTAGIAAAREALSKLAGRRADLVLVHATIGYDQQALLRAITEITGDTPLSGCSGEGVITQAGADERTHAVAVMMIASESMKFQTFQIRGLKSGSKECGEELARRVNSNMRGDSQVLLLYPDALTANCTQLIAALEHNLARPLILTGGTAGETWQYIATYQYHNGEVASDAVSAVLVSGPFEVEIGINHGCEPIGAELTVTKAHANVIDEIDGKSAWSVFKEYLPGNPDELQGRDVVHLSVGEYLEGEAAPGDLLIRAVMGLEKETDSLVFPVEIPAGRKIRMSRRDAQQIHLSTAELAREMVTRRPGEKPVLVFHFDCAGRGAILFGENTQALAIEPVQSAFGKDVPWLGFYTFGEIAPRVTGHKLHNYTLVLCAFYE
jgi:hypothetical protein